MTQTARREGKISSLGSQQIGIIGCGHLGQTLAQVLLDNHFPKENLKVSYGGSSTTLENIRKSGLFENITDNDQLCKKSDMIFIALKSQNFKELKKLVFPKRVVVVSCMAGIAINSFQSVLGIDVFRIMPSGPDTILKKKGIVALFPYQELLGRFLFEMGFKVYQVRREEDLHTFTAGVCLPAALLAAKELDGTIDRTILEIEKDYPDFGTIYQWAMDILPDFETEAEKDEYIRKMTTKGGITECMIDSIYKNEGFLRALRKGIARSKAISEQANIFDL